MVETATCFKWAKWRSFKEPCSWTSALGHLQGKKHGRLAVLLAACPGWRWFPPGPQLHVARAMSTGAFQSDWTVVGHRQHAKKALKQIFRLLGTRTCTPHTAVRLCSLVRPSCRLHSLSFGNVSSIVAAKESTVQNLAGRAFQAAGSPPWFVDPLARSSVGTSFPGHKRSMASKSTPSLKPIKRLYVYLGGFYLRRLPSPPKGRMGYTAVHRIRLP